MIEFTSCGEACFDRKPDIFPIACRYFIYDGAPSLSTQTATIEQLAHYITSGHPWYPMVFAASTITVSKQNFSRASLLAFDLEKGEHSEEKLEKVLKKTGLRPCLIYRTYSWSEGAHRNRIVFQLPKAEINPVKYLLYGVFFWAIYKDIDTSCVDTARLFYGTKDQHYTIDEAAILNLEELVKNGMAAIKEAKDRTPGFYQQIIRKLTSPAMNIKIGEDGLPCVRVQGGNVLIEYDTLKQKKLINKEKNNAPITDNLLSGSTAPIQKITLVNWFEKLLLEPLFDELYRGVKHAGEDSHFGYQCAVVLASNLRFIEGEEVKDMFFNLLQEKASWFSNPEHTIKECQKIWDYPDTPGAGYGCRPLPYAECGRENHKGYAYPLSYIRNASIVPQQQKERRACEDFAARFANFDFETNTNGFIVNGSCAIGKTYTFLSNDEGRFCFKQAIEVRSDRTQRIAFLCSRAAAKNQILVHYDSTMSTLSIDREELGKNKIFCTTYHGFVNLVQNGTIKEDTFDIIIADESHTLFTDYFSEQMGLFLNWSLSFRGKMIWLTACSAYFEKCYLTYVQIQHLPRPDFELLYQDEDNKFVRFLTDETIYSDSSDIDYYIEESFSRIGPQHRALVFLNSAEKCFRWWNRAILMGIPAAFIVSKQCSTEIKKLPEEKLQLDVEEYLKSIGRITISVNELQSWLDTSREARGLAPVYDTLIKEENYPPDIDVIFTTAVIRESVNIQAESNVKTIITDSADAVSQVQERGRVRGDIERYIIVPNKRGTLQGLERDIKSFKNVIEMSQIEMAQEYGKYLERKKLNKNILPIVLQPMKDYYIPNYAGFVGANEKMNDYNELMRLTPEQKKERFVSMVGGNTKFRIESTKERKEEDKKVALKELFKEYLDVPLIGENMEEIMRKTKEIIGKEDFTIKKICNLARELGFSTKNGEITKKQIKQFKLDEKYYRKRYCMIIL